MPKMAVPAVLVLLAFGAPPARAHTCGPSYYPKGELGKAVDAYVITRRALYETQRGFTPGLETSVEPADDAQRRIAEWKKAAKELAIRRMEREAVEMEARLDSLRPGLAAKLKERLDPVLLLQARFHDVVDLLVPDEDYTTWIRPCSGKP